MNKKYNLKLDLQFRCNNSTMKFNQFDNNTSDFFMRITNGGNLVDIEKAIVVLAIIKPSGKVASQFVEVENGLVYADLKSNMRDEIGTYTAKAMLILEDERVVTDSISYEVKEDKIFSLLNDSVEDTEDFTLLTDMLNRLSTIEISEEQRVINEAERILSEENRKIEEAKRVEAELIRQHEEADRAKYDATRESNENIRKQNESIRLANETNRIDEEAKRVEEEANRVEAEQLRKDNYNFMTEDEERRRVEANAHKEAEKLRAQAENTRVNEEAKRRTTEQARVLAENTRVSNENTRKANETTRQTNETKRVEAETQRQNRYNSFIADAEANANNFENYTNSAKVKEEERKSNELNRKSQEDRRVSNEVERISNENTRKANEVAREKNETSRQYVFENKVNEVDSRISELNTTKDNFISNINTKVDTKISEIDNAKSDMTNTVASKVNEVESRFNALTASQQQDAEVIDARVDFKGVAFDSLKERIDYTDKLLRDSTVSTVTTESDFTTVEATSNGYFEDMKLKGKTLVNIYPKATPSLSVADRDNPKYNVTKKEGYIKVTGSDLEATSYRYVNMGRVNFEMFKPNTTYTVIFTKLKGVPRITLQNGNSQHPIVKGGSVNAQDNKLVYTFVTTETLVKSEQILYLWIDPKSTTIDVVAENPMIFEGDLTANPPSRYVKGLKSVGDGVDEISVESVNENLFTTSKIVVQDNLPISYEPTPDGIRVSSDNALGFGVNLKLKAGNTYYFSGKSSNIINVRLYRKGGIAWEDVIFEIAKEEVNCANFSKSYVCTQDAEVYFRFWKNAGASTITDVTVSKKPHTNPIRGEHDKKRLLYYNEETQTWEKPILREWDSIEKHSDGKYYYHKRSGTKVLNGSENWNNDTNSSTMSPATYRQSIQFDAIDIPSASFNTKTSPNIISDLLPTVIFGDVYSYNHIGISISGTDSIGTHIIINNNFIDVTELKQWLQANNLTLVYQLAQEKVYECTNIDLITYNGETNFIVESGVLSPKTTLKVHNNISNVVSLLQKKVSLLENNITSYMITQNRLMLASRYNADTVSFKVDVATLRNSFEYDNDLYELILNNILVGKDNYNREYIENLIIFYWMDFVISDEMHSTLFEIIEEQHNPKVIEEETPLI
jgi:hypothetical protein